MGSLSFTAVIFDCDGVLVDSEPVSNAILAAVLSELGLPTTPAESISDFMGRSWSHVVAVVTDRLGAPPPPDLEQRYRTRLYAAYDAGVPAVPGIAEALDAIELPRCVASSGPHEKIRRGLETAGLRGRFDEQAIFSGQDVAHGKPAPDLFLHAAARMGFDPPHTAVVEDSPVGVEAARAAGMTVFGYAERTPAAALQTAGAQPFASMAELPTLLAT